MSSNMLNLLKNMHANNGIVVNSLIKGKVITRGEVVDAAVESNVPYLIYCVGRYIKGLSKKNIEKLADALIEIANVKYIYDFAVNVKRAPAIKLGEATIKLGTVENIYNYAKNVTGAPINKMVSAIINAGNSEYIYKLIGVNDAPILVLIDALIELKDGWYLCKIANTTTEESIKDKILDAVLYTFNNAKDMYNYAKMVENAPIEKISDAIIGTSDAAYIYKFAKDIKNAPIKRLEDAIIDIGKAEYIYCFARDVKGSSVIRLADALIATREVAYMELFMHIDGAPAERLKLMANRVYVEAMAEDERLSYLFSLAQSNNIDVIRYSADIYRKMFVDTEVDDNISKRAKSRVLKQSVKRLNE